MATSDDSNAGIGAVYGKAILEVANQRGMADQVLEELSAIADYLARDRDFADFIANPLVDAEAKAHLLERAFRGRASDLLVDALEVVNRKERLDLLPAIVEAYRREYRRERDIVDVHVRTAVPLTEELRRRLADAALRYSGGKEAHLIERVDPGLIGGMVVQIGDEKIDSSVATRVKALGAALKRRGAEEIYRGTAYTA